MDSFFDEILNDTHACTHAHTCNPPGPDMSHTHTCFHVHTKILSDEKLKKASKKSSFGNREAVRKYREKKKAWAASLEDEVTQLREINRQLMKRLQGQAALEAEVMRLRCLLVDIRGRIDGEIGAFPYQKAGEISNNPGGVQFLESCDVRCKKMRGKGESEEEEREGAVFGVCDVGEIHCGSTRKKGRWVVRSWFHFFGFNFYHHHICSE